MKEENENSEANILNECNLQAFDSRKKRINKSKNNFQIVLNVEDEKINNYQIKKLAKFLVNYDIKKIQNQRCKVNCDKADNNIYQNLKCVNFIQKGKNFIFSFFNFFFRKSKKISA